MDENNANNNIETNLVPKEERYLRMFFVFIRLGIDKIKSKLSLEKILLKDKNIYQKNIEKLKNDWITVYYNIYDYFISKKDNIYTYFFNELIYLNNEEINKNEELKILVISIMKICLKIYPPTREDIINFYQLFFLKELDQKKFSLLMEIFNIIFSYDKSIRTYQDYYSKFDKKDFMLFDGNSNIEIKLGKEWIISAYKEKPKEESKKNEISELEKNNKKEIEKSNESSDEEENKNHKSPLLKLNDSISSDNDNLNFSGKDLNINKENDNNKNLSSDKEIKNSDKNLSSDKGSKDSDKNLSSEKESKNSDKNLSSDKESKNSDKSISSDKESENSDKSISSDKKSENSDKSLSSNKEKDNNNKNLYNNKDKSYYSLGFCFRYFKKFDNPILARVRFPSKYVIFSIKNGLLNCNIPFKNNAQIPIIENKDYTFIMVFLKERIQILINDTFYETSEGIDETAINLIIGEQFFGVFYKVLSTFTFEPIYFKDGNIMFTHPGANHGKFHYFEVSAITVYENNNYPKKLSFYKKESIERHVNVNINGRILLFKSEKSYMKSLKNYGTFDTFSILLMFFIYRPEFYKKEYIKLIFDKIIENCCSYENEKIFGDNNYFSQFCIILCNFPKEIRDLEIIDYISPLIKYSRGYNYYLDILKIVYGYDPKNNKQPFSFHLIEIMIKKMSKIENIEQLNEIKCILINTLDFFNLGKLNKKTENVAEDIYYLILLYFENYKSLDPNIFFYKPYYFWFITLYIFFFELKNKIKEVDIIYNQIKENKLQNDINDDNSELIRLLNYFIFLSNDDKIDFIYNFSNENKKINYLYISYIFKLYARFKQNKIFEEKINYNLGNIKNIIYKYTFETIEDFKDKSIKYFLIPCIYNLPYISKSLKNDKQSLILELLFEDLLSNETKDSILFTFINLFKNICINLKYTCSESHKYLIYYIKNEIYKQIKKYDFDVDNSFYSIFSNDEENAKLLSINISNLFGDLYSILESDKKANKINHEISKDKLEEYLNPTYDLYKGDYLVSNSTIEQIYIYMISRKNWIKTTQDSQFYYNQNWTDLDFCYNPENKNPKFTIKSVNTNDLKYSYLYRIPNISKVIKNRNKKGIIPDKINDLFKEEIKEPFPVCVHISTKEIKLCLDFILKYHENYNKQIEDEFLKDNKKKYPCCIISSRSGKGFLYVKDENTIEYVNYYELDKAEYYNCIDSSNGITTDKKNFYNHSKIYNITIQKETIKMFFKRINYYNDQALEIFTFYGDILYFVFKEKRDEFLEESGLILKDYKEKENDKDNKNEDDKKSETTDKFIYEDNWRTNYMFRVLYNDLNYKSDFSTKEPLGYISKYFRFPGDNKYWENPKLSDILRKWKEHEISTYTLLMYLNIFGGRSHQDKSQCYIMPQLFILDNNNQFILRNLKIPMGQIKLENNEENLKRITYFDNLYKNEKDKNKAYFYPVSISNEKSVWKNISLIVPYNQISKNMFDDKNNILTSINKDNIDSLININNISESVPEFFTLFECLTNINNIKDLKDEEIELPSLNIIDNSNYNFNKSILFVLTLNKILESKEVNDTIGDWIDLIFGVDQHSEKLKNIYKPECYLNDKSKLEIFKNDNKILNNIKVVGTLPLQLIKTSKFNSLITRKHIPLNLKIQIKQILTVNLYDKESNEIINFTALDSEKFVFFGENKIWNITSNNLNNNSFFHSFPIKNKEGVIKELFNPKMFKKIFAISRLYNYSIYAGNNEDILIFHNHNKLDRAYTDGSKNKNVITAVEIMEYVGYEHYLLVGKQNGHIHHYKIDFGTLDNILQFPDDNQYLGFFYKSILRYHSKEIVSIKYNCYLNLWISASKDGFVHIWDYEGFPILSICIKNKDIKYAILASDPIPSFIVYLEDEIYCYLINQIVPIRKLKLKNEVYNFDIIKSYCFEDFLLCQDDEKIYIISIPYLDIIYEINEKVTSFDYLSKEKLIVGFLKHDNENKVTIKKIKCDI